MARGQAMINNSFSAKHLDIPREEGEKKKKRKKEGGANHCDHLMFPHSGCKLTGRRRGEKKRRGKGSPRDEQLIQFPAVNMGGRRDVSLKARKPIIAAVVFGSLLGPLGRGEGRKEKKEKERRDELLARSLGSLPGFELAGRPAANKTNG